MSSISENSAYNNAVAVTEPYYFTTSTFKFVTMSLVTLGLYQIYWFYKNWAIIKKRSGEKIMPVWRSVFAPLWAYSFFKDVRGNIDDKPENNALPAGVLAFIYFILQALWRLPDPYWLITFAAILLLIPVNNAAIEINSRLTPGYDGNKKFSKANWVGIILGGLLFLLTIVGTFMPADA